MDIKKFIECLNFIPEDGTENVYFKFFPNINYKLKLDFNKNKIDYGGKIRIEDKSTSNFNKEENFVVLECVIRLLNIGYPPENITLEKKWKLGHKEKGRLDILVSEKDNSGTFLMIECKTLGQEYENEKRNMLEDGGQLFSYYQQDKSAKYLCLYSSFVEDEIIFESSIVKIEQNWYSLANKEEAFNHWNKNFKESGIFEDGTKPYKFESHSLKRKQLKELTENDGAKIFNQFAQILRQNVISDKSNAFNKIFNLFLCKIIDEDRFDDEELHFQWLENDTNKSLQKRLNDLYKKGMKSFFDKTITDLSDDELEELFINLNQTTELDILKDRITDLRLQKNQEFAFKEVYDEISFEENGIVVKEIVELLQPYQLKYSHKQQFLGDFFELLLTTGLKQEAGQFFTPTPLAQFIVSSLPVGNLIKNNIDNGVEVLPYVIDYAAGSGHFLTESMDEIQKIIDSIDVEKCKPSSRNAINSWKINPYVWAEDHIYGIELDYRLVKTSKINCFLNGDGTAQIIHGNGLDNFYYSRTYKGKLLNKEESYDNSNFDILITNPPYSVQAFRNTLKRGDETFELYDYLTETSSEIECLFIERAKQLLKVGGIAAIILPISFLTSKGIYFETRKIILKYFNIKSIVILGSSAFMATNTKTMILFLERKDDKIYKKIINQVSNFTKNPSDFTVNGIENAFTKYVEEVFENIDLTDYITLINKKPNEKVREEYIFTEYEAKFERLSYEKTLEKIRDCEFEKLCYYFLSSNQRILAINPGKKTKEFENFLGYRFSYRRGSEGIKFDTDENKNIITPLFDSQDKDNPTKVNYYIRSMFLNQKDFEINKDLEKYLSLINLNELIDFNTSDFKLSINPKLKGDIIWEEVWDDEELIYLRDISTIIKGDTTIRESTAIRGNVPVVAGGKKPAYMHNEANRYPNIITVSASGKYAGHLNYWDMPIFASDCSTIVSNDEEVIETKKLYDILSNIQETLYDLQTGQAQGHVYPHDLKKIKIPKKFLN